MLLDTTQQALIMKTTYNYLITDFGDFSLLLVEDRCVGFRISFMKRNRFWMTDLNTMGDLFVRAVLFPGWPS